MKNNKTKIDVIEKSLRLLEKGELPEVFMGYNTRELIEIWRQRMDMGIKKGTHLSKIEAMDHLVREFKLGEVYQF